MHKNLNFVSKISHFALLFISISRLWWRLPIPDWEIHSGFWHCGGVMLSVHRQGLSMWCCWKLCPKVHGRVQLCGRILWRLQWDGHDVGTGQQWTYGGRFWGTTLTLFLLLWICCCHWKGEDFYVSGRSWTVFQTCLIDQSVSELWKTILE